MLTKHGHVTTHRVCSPQGRLEFPACRTEQRSWAWTRSQMPGRAWPPSLHHTPVKIANLNRGFSASNYRNCFFMLFHALSSVQFLKWMGKRLFQQSQTPSSNTSQDKLDIGLRSWIFVHIATRQAAEFRGNMIKESLRYHYTRRDKDGAVKPFQRPQNLALFVFKLYFPNFKRF